jgi:predicted NUDIX family NTP pyrophosphohydrolase
MPKRSAGILLFRRKPKLEVMLVHAGGPFWAKKDQWEIPKGAYEESEDSHAAAYREFTEELGKPPPGGREIALGEVKVPSGKLITVWAIEADFDASDIKSNEFPLEWPPKSGNKIMVPEVDKAKWFSLDQAEAKIYRGQDEFLRRLTSGLGIQAVPPEQPSLF